MVITDVRIRRPRTLRGGGWVARVRGMDLSAKLAKEFRTVCTVILLLKVFHTQNYSCSLLQLPPIFFSARTLSLSFQERGSLKNLQSRMRDTHRNGKFQDSSPRAEAGIRTTCYGSPEVGHLAHTGKPFREIYFKLIVLFAGFYIDMFCFVLNVFWDCSLFIYY